MTPLLAVDDLQVHFFTDSGVVRAVDGISYSVESGKTLAIVGESGSGKSVTALAIMGLVPEPGRILRGSVRFQDQDLVGLAESKLRRIRGNRIAMIFQDPLTSLNPVFSIGNQIAEVIRNHQGGTKKQALVRAIEMMELVEIPRAAERAGDFPHQFSGGMRQRVVIAMAIAMSPALLIADEPTTALDVTVQAQILQLLTTLQKEFGMAMILITHDLGLVAEHSDDVAVMYAGKIVEGSGVEDIYYRPQHPYTLGLMSSVTRLDKEPEGRLKPIRGAPPSLINVPSGCSFHPRCDYVQPQCQTDSPVLQVRTADAGHLAACHFAGQLPEPKEAAE